ncbi:MAG: hypothetical protein JNK43_05925, partial [Ignavibacteria bacterium]|nr:hypothetical protein [Ignavibacteria bacterium]
RETSSHEFVLSIASSKIRERNYTNRDLIEVSIGTRLYPVKNEIFFTEATLGAQINNLEREYFDWGYYYQTSDSRASFLVTVATGVKLPVTENNSMLLRLGYNTTFPIEEGLSYFSGLIGLSFSASYETGKNKPKAPASKLAIAAAGGYNNPMHRTGYHFSGSGIYIIEGIFVNTRLNELFMDISLNRFSPDEYSKAREIYGIALGPRFFINRDVLSAFVELGGGVYLSDKNEHTMSDPLQPGINLGTGFTGKMTEAMEMFLKGGLCYFLTDNPNFPSFSSVTGGLRFNL